MTFDPITEYAALRDAVIGASRLECSKHPSPADADDFAEFSETIRQNAEAIAAHFDSLAEYCRNRDYLPNE